MPRARTRLALAVIGAASLELMLAVVGSAPASACDIASPTDLSCGPANVNPGNPLSMNNPSNIMSPLNPANPANPANINNPSNPLNPANQWANSPSNPANPLSPLNPANQQSAGYVYGAPAYGLGGVLEGIFGGEATAPAAYAGEGYAPEDAPVHHRHHRRHRHVE